MPKSYNGIGTMFMGQRDFRPDGSYVTTEFFVILLFPVMPLKSYRVIPLGGNKYRVLEELPWHRRQSHSLQLTAFASIMLPIAFVASGAARPLGKDFSLGLAAFLFAAPLLLGWVVRWMAKRRAYEAARQAR
jgi:hypothetical protein